MQCVHGAIVAATVASSIVGATIGAIEAILCISKISSVIGLFIAYTA